MMRLEDRSRVEGIVATHRVSASRAPLGIVSAARAAGYRVPGGILTRADPPSYRYPVGMIAASVLDLGAIACLREVQGRAVARLRIGSHREIRSSVQ